LNLKKKIKFVLVGSFILVLIINIIGGILSFLVFPFAFPITLFISIVIFALILKLYSPNFQSQRQLVMKQAFEKTNHDDLNFKYYKEETLEAFDALDIESLAPNFDISTCIFGTYKGIQLESFNAMYSTTGKKKDAIVLRLYIFNLNKELTLNNKNIKYKLFNNATDGRYVNVKDNKLYIGYGYKNSNLRYSFEPMSHSDYNTFIERYNMELEFIDYIVNIINN